MKWPYQAASDYTLSLDYRLDGPGFGSQRWGGELLQIVQTTLRPRHPPIHRLSDFFSEGNATAGVKLTSYLHLVPRLRMRGALYSLCMSS
jgi:hypothetical protein